MDHDDLEPQPPTALDVARRAAIVRWQVAHVAAIPPRELVAEASAQGSTSDYLELLATLEEKRQQLVGALRSSGLWEDTSLSERAIFECKALELTERQVIDSSWRAEALGCLEWALGLWEHLAPYDMQADLKHVLRLIPVDDLAAFFRDAKLRPPPEIGRARDIAELWHWRSRTRELQEKGSPRERRELDQIVRKVVPRAAADGVIPTPIAGDFPVLGRAYRDLSPREWASAQSIAMERHFALNWLCGYAPSNEWDETPTDT